MSKAAGLSIVGMKNDIIVCVFPQSNSRAQGRSDHFVL